MAWLILATLAAGAEPLLHGGCGGAYFDARPGPLVIDVYKRDRHGAGRTTELRAILVSPDRRVVAEQVIPFDGGARGSGWGAVGHVRFEAQVARAGIYGLNVTVSQDRYGDEIAWGLTTNCPRYVLETSRGHRDERHQEPIVLHSPEAPAEVCFRPRPGEFAIDLEGVAEGVDAVTVADRDGKPIQTLAVNADRRAHADVAAGDRGAVPWRLRLPRGEATVHIDGVTRWDGREPANDLCLWNPHADRWFDLVDVRWLLVPYRRLIHGPPGATGCLRFRLHNNAPRETTIRLSADPGGTNLRPEQEQVTLAAGGATEIAASYRLPAGEATGVLRATTDSGATTYASLTLRPGPAPAAATLTLPLVLKPYEHENEQYGHLPAFPADNQPYFDAAGRPWVLTGRGLARLEAGTWRATSYPAGYGPSTSKVAFDAQGAAYLLANSGRQAALLRLPPGADAFESAALPPRTDAGSSYDLDQFSGANPPAGPPAILRYTQTAADPRRIWRRINDLELFLPRLVDGGLTVGEPILVSRMCIGLAAHSGIPSTVVSRGERVHVTWGEATDPAERVPGVPTYVATYDRAGQRLGEPALVGYGPPANDIHNTPSLTIDPAGLLHVLVGTHGSPFPYTHSLAANDAGGGWGAAKPARDDLPQTYVGLVCGADGTLHTVFRLWRGGPPHPLSTYGTLAYMRKPPGGEWTEPRVLIVPPFSEYSVYYHRLTVDGRGRLFVSYDYWSTYWFYRLDHVGRRRTVLMSPDGGETWKLAQDADLL